MDFTDISKIMNEVQNSIKNTQNDTDNQKTFTAQSGGGLVEVSMNANFEIININIDDTLMDDKESLEILVMSSLNEVIKQVITDKSSMVTDLMKGFMPNNNT